MPVKPREEEVWARQIVSRILSVPVVAFDDGSAASMPDAIIQLSSGSAPLEVFGHWDSDYYRMQHGLAKFGRRIDIAPEDPAWEVTLVHSVAKVKTLVRRLPALVTAYNTELLSEVVPDQLARLGVETAYHLEGQRGFIHLSAAGWNSWDYPLTFGTWLDGLFAIAADVTFKLARHGGTEQHAFLWVASASAWSALDQLEADDDDTEAPLPADEPDVPPNLTDIWIASTLVRPARGILHWKRGTGWKWHPFNLTSADWE
ncbi:hypothetical protein [Cryobacterium sp. Sr3]|uniref:hypothetical protein n=1 Tax=Cryobacterium sp. Sr3 TaxID=1259194 RepID=UPI00106AED3C|nr:hypothetical protein [Cryobacterium sp. Sr3]TFB59940.1 hypothetical protein E3N94_02845 [Cryobacterium sp. Sr3]